MLSYNRFLLCFLLLFSVKFAFAQLQQKHSIDADSARLIQFSGMVLTEENKQLTPVPYTNIYLKNRKRGTFSDYRGFFSFVAEKGEKVVFSSVGFSRVEITIPDTLRDNRYSVVQLMSKDLVNLPMVIIMPWPSREHFKTEFLAMDIKDELQRRAVENLAEKTLKRMRNEVVWDGKENAQYYLREQAKATYYVGQFRPMNIFSPLAWNEFFKAWKAGKFKKQKKEDE